MDLLRYDVKSIRYRGKQIDRGLIIRAFRFRGDISRDKSYCYSISDQSFCTKLSHQKNGVQYVPEKVVKIGQIYFLYISGVMYRMKCVDIQGGYIDFSVTISSSKEMSMESRAGAKPADTVDLEALERKHFDTIRDRNIFRKYAKRVNDTIIFQSEHIQHYKFRRKLVSAGFRWQGNDKAWILK